MTTDHAIAQALLRCAEREHLPREDDDVLAPWRAGRRSAATEIARWLEERAREYDQQASLF